jgi:hypothetical protein
MDGSFRAFIDGFDNDLAALVAEDASATNEASFMVARVRQARQDLEEGR